MLLTWPLLPLLLLSMILKVSSASPAKLRSNSHHNRMLRELECDEYEYFHNGRCCRTCPAGTHVTAHCTVSHARGRCEPCTAGEYFTAAPNGLDTCLPCLTCNYDKVLTKECTPKSNAICECKPGYYCSPDEPCEICNRCSRCDEGQRIRTPCNSTTDTVCEDVSAPESTSIQPNVKSLQTVTEPTNPFKDKTGIKALPTEPPDDPAGSSTVLYITLPILAIIILLGILTAGYCYYKRRAKDKIKNSLIDYTRNSSENTSLDSVQTGAKDPREEEMCPEHQRLMTPDPRRVENVINQTAVPFVQGAQGDPVESTAEPLGDDVETEESSQLGVTCEECGQPQPCEKQWTSFFYTVIENVRQDCILRLVRQLHLTKATIDQILTDNPNHSIERNYKLLAQWREQKGKQASMRAVLRELQDMDLGGCCENILNCLRTKKIPIS